MTNLKPFLYRNFHRIVKVYWFIFRPKTSGAICLIKNNKEEFLLIRQTYGSRKWTLPGGGIKKGEDPQETVTREVKEEVSLDIKDITFLGNYDTNFEYKRDRVFCYRAKLKDEHVAEKIDGGEISEARWFKLDAFPKDQTLALQKTIEMNK